MSWYAASAIMYIQFKDGEQTTYPVWENIFLLEAETTSQAQAKALCRAQEDEGDSQGTLTWEGRPAQWVFGGIRKLLTVQHPFGSADAFDGAEVTYSEFIVPNDEALQKLIAGEAVAILYEE